ncbi:MFS transporter [Aspergillus homomorphus CBS 101889]|uniref:Bicyclomycin resistance protein n=1 Tax=Aspergillus homomorphus (strain CBS 101889) TaxID=1450537 RepID=A0A395HIM6_ASPHC|nr:bicyclomycin resistance protein [Aspergillus homomorphus CBS 101889]RAL07667.1 bicyclomycin resistance protein [Aspergillus homomorphus CBS 101889]
MSNSTPLSQRFLVDPDSDKERMPSRSADDSKMTSDLVCWDGDEDSKRPSNMSTFRKYVITINLGLITFCVTFASSVFSTATTVTAKEYGVSEEVMILGTSLFVLGFALGPMIFGPLSELYGRRTPLFIGFLVFAIFQIPVAVAQNLQTIFICRFLEGVFGSSPLAIVSGNLADMFDPVQRVIAVAVFAASIFIGPVAGPIVGGFAKRLRFHAKNWAFHAPAEAQSTEPRDIFERYLLRPILMLFQEPILLLVTLYMGFIYGFLYLCFEVYPIAFQEVREWDAGVGELPFLAFTVEVLIAVGIIITFTITRYKRIMVEQGSVAPEERLLPMILGGAVLLIGMFWFGWTSNKSIIWVPEVIAGGAIGIGVLLIFLQGLNYIIDVYKLNANSAMAANTLFRSCLGAGFPMFATAMFHKLGVNWAMTLLGCLTAILFPVPILCYIYGARIRRMSRFSPDV